MSTETEHDEKIQKLLREICDHFDLEDRAVRERQIRQWKKLKYYWAGFQRLWWSEVAHDWRIFDEALAASSTDSSYYDKPINVFRAYLESIIAALSITIPSVKCYPDDADNTLDLQTAKAGDKIAELVSKHNDVSLLWLHALFIYCTEGMVACHNYTKSDKSYGTYSEPKYEDKEEEVNTKVCPTCQTEIPQENLVEDQFNPGDEEVTLDDLLKADDFCPLCQQAVEAEITKKKVIITRQVGTTSKPKSRQCMEVYGGLYVKVPNYAMCQADLPYLKYSYECHYSSAIEKFPKCKSHFDNKIEPGPDDPYEAWGRISTQYFGEYPVNTVTINNWWLRPSSFNILNDEEDVKFLKKEFPDGARVVYVNDQYAEDENECLDDAWTITHNPLADYIHFDPLGMLLTSVQEITNDLTSLILQTIEHGIPQTFASPDTVNFNAYSQMEVSPGSIIPTKTQGGKAIADGFYTVKTAMLSGEVLPFTQQIQEAGQLVSGALPSLFGGSQAGGSKTAAQYSMSRAQAQQRLGTTWKMFCIWWKNIFGKVIPAYMENARDDEKYVERGKDGGFINVFIRRAELDGKIGSIELESSEELPATWSQKKDVIMQLLQSQNPEVMATISAPENIDLVAQAIGLDDFEIPGNADREKQYEEIKQLLDSDPIDDGQGGQVSSVEVEPDVDNHQIEALICKSYLVSSAGRLTKVENPNGYKNILLHMKQHLDIVRQQVVPQQEPPSGGQKPIAQKMAQGASNGPS